MFVEKFENEQKENLRLETIEQKRASQKREIESPTRSPAKGGPKKQPKIYNKQTITSRRKLSFPNNAKKEPKLNPEPEPDQTCIIS